MSELIVIALTLLGLLLRLGIPLVVTFLLGWFLRRIDARWREEGLDLQLESQLDGEVKVLQACWEMMGWPEDQKMDCLAYLQPQTPCWEIFQDNGIPREKCVSCDVRLQPAVLARV